MTYKWKLPGIVPVEAQVAGEELDRIYQKYGELQPSAIVDESRDSSAPLHKCFEWDDQTAAEKYRETQAKEIVRQITVVSETTGKQPNVRAFVHVEGTYKPIDVVLRNEDNTAELLSNALRELKAFREKYNSLSALRPVFDALEQIAV